jgi:hypothetical protein
MDDYDPEGASTLPNVVAEEKEKIGNGDWQPYGIIVEYAVPGEEDVWEQAASVWGTVTDAGLDGTYDAPKYIGSDYLMETAQDVWSEALTVMRRTLKEARSLTSEEREQLQEAARKDVESTPRPRSLPRLIINAGELRDIWRHLEYDLPYLMRLTDGTEIEVVAGDPQSEEIGREHADLDEIEVRSTSL